jgi:hypothetical protein
MQAKVVGVGDYRLSARPAMVALRFQVPRRQKPSAPFGVGRRCYLSFTDFRESEGTSLDLAGLYCGDQLSQLSVESAALGCDLGSFALPLDSERLDLASSPLVPKQAIGERPRGAAGTADAQADV